MSLGRIGGAFIVIASALVAVTAALAAGGSSVAVMSASLGGLTATLALALLGFGSGLLAIAGPSPLNGRLVRGGMLILATGVLIATASSSAEMDSMLIFVLLIGAAVTWIGGIATAVGLLLTPGWPRQIGLRIGTGLVLAMAGAGLTSQPSDAVGFHIVGILLGAVGVGTLVVGVASIGLIGLRSARSIEAAAG